MRIGDVPIDWAASWLDRKLFAKALPEASNGILVERKFACRQDADTVMAVVGELGSGIEQTQGFDFAIEQIDANGTL